MTLSGSCKAKETVYTVSNFNTVIFRSFYNELVFYIFGDKTEDQTLICRLFNISSKFPNKILVTEVTIDFTI